MRQQKILIVDDEPAVCESLEEWFREDGFQVATALNGKDALQPVFITIDPERDSVKQMASYLEGCL